MIVSPNSGSTTHFSSSTGHVSSSTTNFGGSTTNALAIVPRSTWVEGVDSSRGTVLHAYDAPYVRTVRAVPSYPSSVLDIAYDGTYVRTVRASYYHILAQYRAAHSTIRYVSTAHPALRHLS
eukprot:1692601-Rhodomonas_salina.1